MSAQPPEPSGLDPDDPIGIRYPNTARIWNYQLETKKKKKKRKKKKQTKPNKEKQAESKKEKKRNKKNN